VGLAMKAMKAAVPTMPRSHPRAVNAHIAKIRSASIVIPNDR
jgi:hypothetical protein